MAKSQFVGPNAAFLTKFLANLQSQAASVKAGQGPANYGGYRPVDLSNYVPQFSPEQNSLLQQTGVSPSKAASDPKIMQILNQVESQNAKLDHPENTSHRHGIVSRVFDIMQRPMYATMEGAKQAGEAAATGGNIGDVAKGFGRGALLGVEGKRKTDAIQILQEIKDLHAAEAKRGLKHGWFDHASGPQVKDALAEAKANPGMGGKLGIGGTALGFGLDVVGDPLTYTGLGAASKVKMAAGLSEDAAKALDTVQKAQQLSPEARDLITGAHYAKGMEKGGLSQKAAKAAEPRVAEIAQKVAKAEGALHYDKTIGQLKDAEVGTSKEIMHAAKQAANKRETEVMKNIMDNYNKVVNTKISRQLAIKGPGGVKIAVPGTDLLAAAAKGAIQRVDPVAKGMRAFNNKFSTMAGAFPELHSQVLSHFGQGMGEAHRVGREINRALNPLGSEGRTEAWHAFLNGHPSANLVKLPHGETMDAAKWIESRVAPIITSIGEHDIKPRDLQPWLPPSLKVSANKIVVNGKKVEDPNWLLNSMKQWSVKDGGKNLWFLHSAFEKTKAYKSMLQSMGDTFGAHLPKEFTDAQKGVFEGLKKKGWVSPHKVIELQHHVFDPETAKYITHIAHTLRDDREFNKFWGTFAKIQKPIKFALTLPNPSFHWHNAVGDAFINHLDNISPLHYAKSASILKHRNQWFEQYNPAESQYPLMSREGDPLEVAANLSQSGPGKIKNAAGKNIDKGVIKNTMRLQSADGKVHPYIKASELYAGYNKFGLRQNYASELGFHDGSPAGKIKNVVDKIQSASEAREDYFRLAHFIGLIEKNQTKSRTLEQAMEQAARRVRQTHFDYTDFTKFEKQVMSQIFPFYKWTRKALPLMSQIMMTDPGKAVLVPKGLRALAALTGNNDMVGNDTLPNLNGAIVPKWMMDSGYVPVAKDFMGSGNPAFSYVPNPWSDMFTQQLQGLSGGAPNLSQLAFGQASPLIKTPIELMLNKNLYTGGKIVNSDPGKAALPIQLMQYLASQVPATNVALRTSQQHGSLAPLLSYLGPASIQEDTPQRQKSELVRQRDVSRAKERVQKYKHRNDPKL